MPHRLPPVHLDGCTELGTFDHIAWECPRRPCNIPKPAEFLSSRYGWVVTNQVCDIDAVHGWLVHVQETLWSLVHPWLVLVCIMVLVTFRFIGLAHLHTLWGCLAFVGFPLGLAWFVRVFAPLVSFLRCWLVFHWAVCTFGVVWAPWPPWSRLFPLGLCPRCSWRAFVVGCCGCCCGCPSLCAVYLGAVQIKVHTSPGRKLRYFVRVPLKVQRRRGSIDGTGAWISKPQKIIDFTVISLAQLGV